MKPIINSWIVNSRSDWAMTLRTFLELVLSWLCANLPEILGLFNMSSAVKALVSSFFMMVFTWGIGELRKRNEKELTATFEDEVE